MKPLYESIGDIVRRIYDMRIEGPPILNVGTHFPSAEEFSRAWQSIRDEAQAVARQMHRVPRFHEIMREQTSISANDMRDWRMFILKAYGVGLPEQHGGVPHPCSISDSKSPRALGLHFIPRAGQAHPGASRTFSRRAALLPRYCRCRLRLMDALRRS